MKMHGDVLTLPSNWEFKGNKFRAVLYEKGTLVLIDAPELTNQDGDAITFRISKENLKPFATWLAQTAGIQHG